MGMPSFILIGGKYKLPIIKQFIHSTFSALSSARILYVRSAGKKIYLDVYTNIPGEYNDFIISAACLIGFSLQEPEEVDEAIPEGYSVKEFTL